MLRRKLAVFVCIMPVYAFYMGPGLYGLHMGGRVPVLGTGENKNVIRVHIDVLLDIGVDCCLQSILEFRVQRSRRARGGGWKVRSAS